MKPTLCILAAGMGSRYGGLKQIDGLGPHGETIMDYSIYDAIKGGFGKVVFVIRRDFEKDFKEKVVSKYENMLPIEIVFQSVDSLPKGFLPNPKREKPWGTNHAILMAKEVIHEPFAIINADDYYGQESFRILADYLISLEGKKGLYGMIGYRVGNTLSEGGTVSRGICTTNENGELTSIVEHTKIERIGNSIISHTENGDVVLQEGQPVSMNMLAFTPDYFTYSEEKFIDFLREHSNDLKAEYFIPSVIGELIAEKKAVVKVIDTPSKWFGVTYPKDRDMVVAKLLELHQKGIYPEKLF